MSFLILDGLTIPVVGGEEESVVVGEDRRVFSGAPLKDRRAVHRNWKFGVRHQTQAQAEALKSMLMGRGEQWRWSQNTYDSDGILSNNAFGDKGTAPTTVGTEAFDMFPVIAADGASIFQTDPFIALPGAPWETCRLAVEPATNNLLPANTRNAENAPTGFAAIGGATLAGDNNKRVSGSRSLKVTGVLNGGVLIGNAPVAGGQTYTHSFYIRGNSGSAFEAKFWDDAGGFGTTTSVTGRGDVWLRVELTDTAAPGATQSRVQVKRTTGSGGSEDFWIDSCQVEERDHATTWVDGSRAAGNLRVPATYGRRGVTVAFDAILPSTANNCGLIRLAGDSTSANYVELYRSASLDLVLIVRGADGVQKLLTLPGGSIWDGDLWDVVFTIEDGVEAKLYVDGQLEGTVSPISAIDRTAITHAQLGYSQLYTTMRGHMGALRILPWVASADQINEWYQAEHAPAQWPRVYARGDFVETPSPGEVVEGSWGSSSYTPRHLDGSHANNAQELSFTLQSVGEV